jgi:hypothetical protein
MVQSGVKQTEQDQQCTRDQTTCQILAERFHCNGSHKWMKIVKTYENIFRQSTSTFDSNYFSWLQSILQCILLLEVLYWLCFHVAANSQHHLAGKSYSLCDRHWTGRGLRNVEGLHLISQILLTLPAAILLCMWATSSVGYITAISLLTANGKHKIGR